MKRLESAHEWPAGIPRRQDTKWHANQDLEQTFQALEALRVFGGRVLRQAKVKQPYSAGNLQTTLQPWVKKFKQLKKEAK